MASGTCSPEYASPVSNGYLTLQQLACEGAELGKIVFGTERFSVQFVAGAPTVVRRR